VSIDEHRRIGEAIQAGEAVNALEVARAHRICTKDELLPMRKSYGLRHL